MTTMVNSVPASHVPPLGILMRWKLLALRNRMDQAVRRSPLKVGAGVIFGAGIWFALYELFLRIFGFTQQRWALETVIARPLLFEMLFAVLTVMLAFSSGIIVYGGLFKQREATYLMASPLLPAQIVRLKHFEALFFASWSLIVLGVPLMLAFAKASLAPWYFHICFLAFFLAFVPLPGAVGTLVAGVIALWFPRSARRALLVLVAMILLAVTAWFGSLWYAFQGDETLWIKRFYAHVAVVRSAVLPSTWVTRGIHAAAEGNLTQTGFYLLVLLANALFSTWLVVRVLAGRLAVAFDRTQGVTVRRFSASASASEVAGKILFAYMPRRLRLCAIKDLRTFVRDAMQWSQMAILFGLLFLYVLNIPRITRHLDLGDWQFVVSFLNLTTVALILATFTGRFVFPLVSLEAQQLWLVGTWPMTRRRLLVGKWLFALTLTLLAALAVIALSSVMLELTTDWAVANVAIITSICVGLCGLSVGLGARFAVLDERNPARIAGGLGGTLNLIASVLYVCLVLAAAAYAHWHAADQALDHLDTICVLVIAGIVAVSVAVAVAALRVGTARIESLEA